MEINKAKSCNYHLSQSSLLVDVYQAEELAICITYCLKGRKISTFFKRIPTLDVMLLSYLVRWPCFSLTGESNGRIPFISISFS